MDDDRDTDGFVPDEVNAVCKGVIEDVLGGMSYDHSKVQFWVQKIIEKCQDALCKEQKPFKYVIQATIMQKVGAGLQISSSCYWNNDVDGSCTVRFENRTMYCLISVFGLGI